MSIDKKYIAELASNSTIDDDTFVSIVTQSFIQAGKADIVTKSLADAIDELLSFKELSLSTVNSSLNYMRKVNSKNEDFERAKSKLINYVDR